MNDQNLRRNDDPGLLLDEVSVIALLCEWGSQP